MFDHNDDMDRREWWHHNLIDDPFFFFSSRHQHQHLISRLSRVVRIICHDPIRWFYSSSRFLFSPPPPLHELWFFPAIVVLGEHDFSSCSCCNDIIRWWGCDSWGGEERKTLCVNKNYAPNLHLTLLMIICVFHHQDVSSGIHILIKRWVDGRMGCSKRKKRFPSLSPSILLIVIFDVSHHITNMRIMTMMMLFTLLWWSSWSPCHSFIQVQSSVEPLFLLLLEIKREGEKEGCDSLPPHPLLHLFCSYCIPFFSLFSSHSPLFRL